MDASISLDEATGSFNIIPDRKGRKLNVEETLNTFRAIVRKNGRIYPLSIVIYAEADVTEEALRAHPPVYRLSAYTTYYGTHDSANRIHNIQLIANWINNTLLLPGEVFSLTELIGDFTVDKGFKEAFVIVGDELVPELGGGTCQIGTTLYNAAALADLKVHSRRNHSFYFNIYPLGRDATIYPGQADFKFENDTPYPVLIKAQATNRKLSFRLYGTPSGKFVRFSAPEIYLLDKEGVYRTASLKEVIQADRPFRIVIERKVFDKKGQLVASDIVRSYYKMYGDKTNVPIRRPEPR
jgi:vancomycin resistance protein YoaR